MTNIESVSDIRSQMRARAEKDPTWYGRAVLKRKRWKRQVDLRVSAFTNRYTLVYSGHGVGKTHELASIALEWLPMNPGGRIVCMGPTFDAVRYGLWAKIRAAYDDAQGAQVIGGRMMDHEWQLGHEWDARIAAVDNPDALNGARGRKVLILIDEAQGVPHQMFTAVQSIMTATDSRLVASGNPLYPEGWFYEAAHAPGMWNAIQISCMDHPNVIEGREIFEGAVTRQWISERLAEYGSETDPRYIARVLGKFPSAGGMLSVITLADLETASEGTLGVRDERRIGFDVARKGGDSNALTVYDERRHMIHCEKWTEDDTMVSLCRLQDAMRCYGVKPENVKVDACGIGGPLMDRLAEVGIDADPVDFGAGAEYDWRDVTGETTEFKNRRAELYWVMRELLRKRQICIPRKFTDVWRDLLAVKRKIRSDDRGVILLEAKEDVRKDLGRSPDCGDAAVIALSNVGAWTPLVAFVGGDG